MPDYMLAFVIAAGVALLITPGVIFLAAKTGAMDAPDARKVHKRPIPRIGGLGIYLVKKNTDGVTYQYQDNQNVLTLKKLLQ